MSQGLTIREGADHSRIVCFEESRNLRLPEDFRGYLELVDGMEEGEADGRWFRFWSLQEIESLPAFCQRTWPGVMRAELQQRLDGIAKPESCLVFADQSEMGQILVLQLLPSESVYMLGVNRPIASSFSEFVDIIVSEGL